MELILFISYLLLGVSTVYSIVWIYKLLKRKSISGYLFITPVILVFYIAPILTDYLKKIKFDKYDLIFEALIDIPTSIFYNFYVTFLIVLFTYFAKRQSNQRNISQYLKFQEIEINAFLIKIYCKYKFLMWLLLVLPLIVFLSAGNTDYYSYYVGRSYDTNIPAIHSLLSKLCLLSVIIASFLMTIFLSLKKYRNKNEILLFFLVLSILIIDFWLHGKRSIVAIFFFCFLLLIILTKIISFSRLIKLSVIMLIGFGAFLSFYGKNISSDSTKTYNAFRTDFSRDYGVKFVMYNDLLNDRPILPQKMTSLIFYSTFFVPRSMWADKPQPYAVYFTNSAFGNFGEDRMYGWGLTTSIFAESISNFGFLGLLIAPLILIWILSRGEKSKNTIFKLLSILISILLLLLQPISFMILILLFFTFILMPKKRLVWK